MHIIITCNYFYSLKITKGFEHLYFWFVVVWRIKETLQIVSVFKLLALLFHVIWKWLYSLSTNDIIMRFDINYVKPSGIYIHYEFSYVIYIIASSNVF